MFDFKDQVVIVTGSGSKRGIGRGIANMFAEAGAQVIIADMNEQGCKYTVAEIQAAGYKADGFVLNIADEDSVNAFVKNVKDKYGKIDVLVNNAGITQRVTSRYDACRYEARFQRQHVRHFPYHQSCCRSHEGKKIWSYRQLV